MAEETSDIMAARERMIAKRFGGANATRTGGVRRKKKNVHKTATSGKCLFKCLIRAYISRKSLTPGTIRTASILHHGDEYRTMEIRHAALVHDWHAHLPLRMDGYP